MLGNKTMHAKKEDEGALFDCDFDWNMMTTGCQLCIGTRRDWLYNGNGIKATSERLPVEAAIIVPVSNMLSKVLGGS